MKNKPASKGTLLGILKTGEWHEFNDGQQFLHSISLMRIDGIIKIALLLENPDGKQSTLTFPANTSNTVDNTEKVRRFDAQF